MKIHSASPTGTFPSICLELYFNNAGAGIIICGTHFKSLRVFKKGSAPNVQTHAYPNAASQLSCLNTLTHLGSWWILTHKIHELRCG